MTAKYQLTGFAENDLVNIWLYTYEKWGEKQADKYAGELKACFEKLSKNPSIGKILLKIRHELRSYLCKYHYVFYLEKKSSVIIIAVYHEKMDLLSRLKSRLK